MKVLNFEKKGGAFVQAADDLDTLWDRAEALGDVTLGPKMFNRGEYEAEIQFRRGSGSFVMAKGVHKDKHQAMKLAISEALALGAVERPS